MAPVMAGFAALGWFLLGAGFVGLVVWAASRRR